ncbi:MAG TPA: lytic transglycosylase domain-containing protein [Bauldia sp.]|nr:lytic transglycosylase domain-containing protein [Bauldia sp.]
MALRATGQMRRHLRNLTVALLAGAGTLALILPLAGEALAKAKPKPAATVSVPLPRLNPVRAGNAATASTKPAPAGREDDDAIGALISKAAPDETTATEDSDAPETASVEVEPTSPPTMPAPKGGKPIDAVGLRLAVKLLENNDPGAATLAAYALPDKVDIKIVNWLIATGGYAGVSSAAIADLQKKLADWPNQALMRIRYEQALAREQPAPDAVIRAFPTGRASSADGKMLLANAYLSVGRRDDAAKVIRAYWREENFAEATEKKLLASFAGMLRPADHKYRMDRLFYAGRAADALRVAPFLDKGEQALAKAMALVVRESSKAGPALDALPAGARRDTIYTFGRIQVLRRAGKIDDAAKLLAAAPRDAATLVDPDAWWVERRLISRALIELNNPRLAYTIAANHAAESPTFQAEAEFHAGWYALEYLHNPAMARDHFAAIAALSKMPLSLSRAQYWLGRTAEAAGDPKTARAQYANAAVFRTTFYGQLAAARIGGGPLAIGAPPAANATTRATFASRELVIAIRHLTAVGYDSQAAVLYRHLAETLSDPGEIALLAGMAEDSGNHQLALQIGKTAAVRGLPVEALAFPTAAIPASAKTPSVERPVVFAIARQESAFNPGAISSAGARGLLQLMPATAKQVAKDVGLPYSKARLTADPGYNATLGAAHLGDLVDTFGGSYVMTFAAYNAGASRVAQWVKDHGDPRDPNVDVVNWIELIPFTETRNYVQRIIENLQVYRARLGSPALRIEADLRRGAAG